MVSIGKMDSSAFVCLEETDNAETLFARLHVFFFLSICNSIVKSPRKI